MVKNSVPETESRNKVVYGLREKLKLFLAFEVIEAYISLEFLTESDQARKIEEIHFFIRRWNFCADFIQFYKFEVNLLTMKIYNQHRSK